MACGNRSCSESKTTEPLLARNREFAIDMILDLPTKSVSKVKVKQSRYRPGVAQRVQEVKVPRFHDNGTGWW